MREKGWRQPFERHPVEADGRALVTLRDAADYVMKLPKAEQEKPHWQLAVEMLILAAEGRVPIMFASIGMLKALKHGKPSPALGPRRKPAKRYKVIR